VEVLGSLEETREMELYTGADEIQIQVRIRGTYKAHLVTGADFKSPQFTTL
jgi:hypothetical protein